MFLWLEDEEAATKRRQPSNEVRWISHPVLLAHFTVPFATPLLCSSNSTVPLISLPDLSVFSLFSPPACSLCLHLLPLSVSLSPLPPPPSPLPLTDVEADALGPQKESVSDIKRPNEWEPPVCVPAAKWCSCTGAGWHKQKPPPSPSAKFAAEAGMWHVRGLRLRQMS